MIPQLIMECLQHSLRFCDPPVVDVIYSPHLSRPANLKQAADGEPNHKRLFICRPTLLLHRHSNHSTKPPILQTRLLFCQFVRNVIIVSFIRGLELYSRFLAETHLLGCGFKKIHNKSERSKLLGYRISLIMSQECSVYPDSVAMHTSI